MMPCSWTGPKTPRAVPDAPPVTSPMMRRISAAFCGEVACAHACGWRSYSIFGFISLPSRLAMAAAASAIWNGVICPEYPCP
jgi:hypothetical protein